MFLPRNPEDESSDGLVALDCLRIAQFAVEEKVALQPGCRILGLVWDAAKGELLERRLAAVAGSGESPRFTIVAGERLRHHYIMQNVYVRGLHNVYFELMSSTSTDLGRFVVTGEDGEVPAGMFDPWDLVCLVRQRGDTLVGLELCSEQECGSPRVVLDPRALAQASW